MNNTCRTNPGDTLQVMNLEEHFAKFRKNIIGIDHQLYGPYGPLPLVYADWIASGRLYRPIEERIINNIGPMVANTHSEASSTGKAMTQAYHRAQCIIKEHVGAATGDVLISAGNGMTAVVNKLQRILGLKIPERYLNLCKGLPSHSLPSHKKSDENTPVVFLTHMEHHSNHLSWLESLAEVVVLQPDEKLGVSPSELERQLQVYRHRTLKIGSFCAASNVTGFFSPYGELASIMHKHGGFAFADFATAAPYVDIAMHPGNNAEGYLDGVFFSPHKFLGGPGSAGVLVFNSRLYHNSVPDNPGGGTVNWTNRWGERSYVSDIEAREDGGTPAFLQTIRAALAMEHKNSMGTSNIAARERELLLAAVPRMRDIPGLRFLGDEQQLPLDDQLGALSFTVENIHHNLVVALMNDRFGVQLRGGCSCAGTYGHWLLRISREASRRGTAEIDDGYLGNKPGWVRLSLHPTMTNGELDYIIGGLESIVEHIDQWKQDYLFNNTTGEFDFRGTSSSQGGDPLDQWFAGF